MIVAYPTRAGYRTGPDPLRWSVRTAFAHLPVTGVIIVGDLPRWVDPSTVTHIPTQQTGPKFVNIGVNIAAIAAAGPPAFTWFNDDFFMLDTAADIPLYHRAPRSFKTICEHLRSNTGTIEHRAFVIGMRQQYDLLVRWGFDDPVCTDLHVPIPIDRARLRRILKRRDRDAPDIEGGHFRALYGAGLDSHPLTDVKREHVSDPPEKPFHSTSPTTWKYGVAGKVIRSHYWQPSPIERA